MQSPVKIWRNQPHIRTLLGETGEIVSWTIIRVPPGTHNEYAPYCVALVKLITGSMITVQCVDTPFKLLKVGMKVQTVLRRMNHPRDGDVIQYGVKVKPE